MLEIYQNDSRKVVNLDPSYSETPRISHGDELTIATFPVINELLRQIWI
jgi:hypothetical protein